MLRFACKSVMFHWRLSFPTLLGVALGCAVLTGSLIMGTSVRYTLTRAASLRLGQIDYMIGSGERLFPADLSTRTGVEMAPLLLTRGVVVINRGNGDVYEIPNVQVIGVDQRFRDCAAAGFVVPGRGELFINQALATRLPPPLPEYLSVRVPVPGLLPREAPLAQSGDRQTARFRARMKGIVAAEQMGNFNLAAEQQPLPTVFVSLSNLQNAQNCRRKANVFIARGTPEKAFTQTLAAVLQPEDYGVRIQSFPELGKVAVTSERVFLDKAVTDALAVLPGAQPVLTYLVNSIRLENGPATAATPYSFVEAGGTDRVRINSWLAEQLGAVPGNQLTVAFYVMDAAGGFKSTETFLNVDAVEPVEKWAGQKQLVPDFPGLTNVESCAAWDIGLPMDEKALQDPANEAYWEDYGPTPKLKVPYPMGEALWGSKYGDTTAVHFPLDDVSQKTIRERLLATVGPDDVGLIVRDVRREAASAVDNALDFGQLFTGMSFFIVVSALLLVGLLTAFSLEKRLQETGVLGAIGYTPMAIRRQMLEEMFILLVPGILLGLLAGPLYARLLITGVNSWWQGAVARADIHYSATPGVFLTGAVAVMALGMLVTAWVIWKQSRVAPIDLIRGIDLSVHSLCGNRKKPWLAVVGILCLLSALMIAGLSAWLIPDAMTAPFFAAGSLMLTGFSLILLHILRLHGNGHWLEHGRSGMTAGGLSRRPTRTTLIVFLTATGCFLVFAVAGMSRNVTKNAHARASGTGGFELYASASMPILPVRTAENPGGTFFADVPPGNLETVVPLRVREGADASCLNLNAVKNPRIYGVDPAVMRQLNAFETQRRDRASVWRRLEMQLSDAQGPLVPALAGDIDTAAWGLQMKAHPEKGGVLTYRMANGQTLRMKLVGRLPARLTVFQGSILIDAGRFGDLFPDENGFRAFLLDTVPAKTEDAARNLREAYGRSGLDVVRAEDRLQAFYTVEATYLQIFLILGGMGVLLGMAGLGIVTLRTISERRREFALMQATGFPRRWIHAMVLKEAMMTLGLGMLFGGLSAVIAVAPGLLSGATRPPLNIMVLVAAAIVANGLLWASVAAHQALNVSLVPALRSE